MISIVIPAKNEEKRLPASLDKLASFLTNWNQATEVIVVNDASRDKTQAVIESFQDKIDNLKIINLKASRGKGWAVNQGIFAASGDIILFTDADFSTPIEEISKLLEKINSGADIAIGSRALNRDLVTTHQNFFREAIGRIGNILIRLVGVRGIYDTQCGFKMFTKSAANLLFPQQKIFGFTFDAEILFLAQRQGLKIAEVPVIWNNDPRSSVNPLADSLQSLLDLARIRIFHGSKSGSFIDRLGFLIYRFRTFWRFSVVGFSNTLVDFLTFFTLTRGFGMDALKANPLAVEAAILWSFFWNSRWTFSKRSNQKNLLLRFLIFQFISLGGLALSQITLLVFHKILDLPDIIAKLFTLPIIVLFNYGLNSRWTFREQPLKKTYIIFFILFVSSIFVLYFLLLEQI